MTKSFQSLGVRIPTVAALLLILLATTLTVFAVVVASSSLHERANNQLKSVVDERAGKIGDYAAQISADLHVMVEDTGFQRALRTFDNLVGETAEPGSAAALAREQYDPRFKTIAKEKHYADLLLIDEKGTVAFSVSHKHEGQSVAPGTGSSLSQATKAALAATTPGVVAFADFNSSAPDARAYLVQALPDVNGGWLGVLAIEIDLTTFSKTFNDTFGSTGAIVLSTADGRGRSVAGRNPPSNGPAGNTISVSTPVNFLGETWSLTGQQAVSEIEEPVNAVKLVIISTAIIMILISTGLMIAYMRIALSRPINRMTSAMQRLAAGHLDIVIPALDKSDEIGAMAQSVVVFRDAAVENERLQAEAHATRLRTDAERKAAEESAIRQERERVIGSIGASLARMAAGDLTNRMQDDVPAAYRTLQQDFNAALQELDRAVASVSQAAIAIDGGTRQIESGSGELSRHIEMNAASLEETAAALTEVASTVQKSVAKAREARAIVATTRAGAQKGGAVISEAIQAMQRIEESSSQISQIIGVVD